MGLALLAALIAGVDAGTAPPAALMMESKSESPPKPTLTISDATIESGLVDREALETYVKARKAALSACYEKEWRRKQVPAKATNTLKLRWTIDSSGRAKEMSAAGGTLAETAAVVQCEGSILRTWVFPFKPEKPVRVSLDLSWTDPSP